MLIIFIHDTVTLNTQLYKVNKQKDIKMINTKTYSALDELSVYPFVNFNFYDEGTAKYKVSKYNITTNFCR